MNRLSISKCPNLFVNGKCGNMELSLGKLYCDEVKDVCFYKEWLRAQQKLEKIKEIADKACINGCKCIDKIGILQIIESNQ